MASASCPLDRAQYPIIERRVGRDGTCPLVYLDSAATALVPDSVIEAHGRFLRTSCANIHRGAHRLAEEATDAFESAREHVAAFFGVDEPEHVVLTHGATESLNLAALGWAAHHLVPGDLAVVAADNHHSNLVPWQMLAERQGLCLAWLPLTPEGLLDEEAWASLAEQEPKLVALCQQSNVLGFRQPALARIATEARAAGAMVVMDGAQAAGHEPVDFAALGADFYAVSAHKMGALPEWGRFCAPRAPSQACNRCTGAAAWRPGLAPTAGARFPDLRPTRRARRPLPQLRPGRRRSTRWRRRGLRPWPPTPALSPSGPAAPWAPFPA